MTTIDICDGCGKVGHGRENKWVEVHVKDRCNVFAHNDYLFCPKCLGIESSLFQDGLSEPKGILKALKKMTKIFIKDHPKKPLPEKVRK